MKRNLCFTEEKYLNIEKLKYYGKKHCKIENKLKKGKETLDLAYRANARSSKHASPRLLKQQQKTKTKTNSKI